MQSAETVFLTGLEDTEVTTDAKESLHLSSQTWVIAEKLEETTLLVTQEDIDGGLGPAFTVAKFLCHRKGDPTKKCQPSVDNGNSEVDTDRLCFYQLLRKGLTIDRSVITIL